MGTTLVAPLSDQEIDELEAFLESDATPHGCMDISAVDGFLTALALGPSVPLPSRWMTIIARRTQSSSQLIEREET